MDPNKQIAELIEPTLRDMGFELVRVLLHGGQRPTLQVMAERADRAPMTVEHCAEISRAVSAVLDGEVVRVMCRACLADHRYRHGKGGKSREKERQKLIEEVLKNSPFRRD